MQSNTTDLRNDLTNAIAVAREKFAGQAGSQLAAAAGVAEDMIWRLRYNDTLDGQVSSGYEPSTVAGIVKAFADLIGGTITDWRAADDLSGVETSAPFAGLKVMVWGVM